VIALGLWLGALVMAGAAAAILFPTMRDLAPTLGRFEAYTGEHWRLAAGIPAARLFAILDLVQFLCAGAAFATLAAGLASWLGRSASTAVRTVAVGVAMASFSYGFFIVGTRMTELAKTYWAEAEAGNLEAAERAQSAFSAMHPRATQAMGVTAVSVAVGLVAGAWQATGGAGSGKAHGEEG